MTYALRATLGAALALAGCGTPALAPAPAAAPVAPHATAAAFGSVDAEVIEASLPRRWREDPQDPLRVLRGAQAASFTRGSSRLAVAELELDLPDPQDRAIALYAISAGGAVSELTLLLERLRTGADVERAAVLLGLGELERAPLGPIYQALDSGGELLGKAAAFALVRRGGSASDRLDMQTAKQIAEYLDDPVAAPRDAVGELYMTLRYEAAKRFGLLDGRSFRLTRIDALAQDPEFLDALVLPRAGASRLGASADHLLSILLERPSAPVIAAAFAGLATELDQLVENGLWLPADDDQWDALLGAMEAEGVGPELAALLEQAQIRSGQPLRAAALLLEAGLEGGYEILEPQLRDSEPKARLNSIRALGQSSDPQWVAELERAETDSSPFVRVAALVGRLELGDTSTAFDLDSILADPEDKLRNLVTLELCDHASDPRSMDLLERNYEALDPDMQLRAACALLEAGRRASREVVHTALARRTAGPLESRAVRALGRAPRGEDLTLLARLFPAETPEADLALASVLIASQHPLGAQLLRAAVWAPNFERGVLAAHALADIGGLIALHEELAAPPPRITPEDLRRVGFVIGEIGGIAEFNRLARTRGSQDPVLQGAYFGALTARTR